MHQGMAGPVWRKLIRRLVTGWAMIICFLPLVGYGHHGNMLASFSLDREDSCSLLALALRARSSYIMQQARRTTHPPTWTDHCCFALLEVAGIGGQWWAGRSKAWFRELRGRQIFKNLWPWDPSLFRSVYSMWSTHCCTVLAHRYMLACLPYFTIASR